MDYKISGYKPEKLFHFFEEFSAVPRGSGFENEASDFLVRFAQDRRLDVTQDDAYNVIIRKPGSAGAEERPAVILQGHIDMVCEKTAGCDHDFHEEGIDMQVKDGWVTANGTTLGADDGIAVAIMMTILDDNSMVHPPLECVFTTGEEEGLCGADVLHYEELKGRILINIDSEDEGIATVSCAGGMETILTKPIRRHTHRGSVLHMDLQGLRGGHSGSDIDKERINAIHLAARAANRLLRIPGARLTELNGGSKDNAIPRECRSAVWFPTSGAADAGEAELKTLSAAFANELAQLEPDFRFSFTREDGVSVPVLTREDSRQIVSAVLLSPNGVRRRDPAMDNFVITSLNLGIIRTEEHVATLIFAPRSSVDSLQDFTSDLLQLTADTFGFSVMVKGQYPGWEKVEHSKILETFTESYRSLFGQELRAEGIHAGLECGQFFAALPGLDPISIGPTLEGVHTPDERMNLASAERCFRLVADVLRRLSD